MDNSLHRNSLKSLLVEIDDINKNLEELTYKKKDLEYNIVDILCRKKVFQWLKLDINKMRREL